MNAKFKCDNPEDMQFTLTMSLTLREWLSIADALMDGRRTSHKLYQIIMDMQNQATKHFWLNPSQMENE